MTTHHVSGSADLRLALDAGLPGDRFVLRGGVYDALDSYAQRIQGGAIWGKRTRLEAYRAERVVFRSTADGFPIRLAHDKNSFLQIGTAANPFELDGQRVSTHGLKVTNASGAGRAHHVSVYAHVHAALGSGVLVTSTDHVELYGSSRDNGWRTEPESANKDHGIYLGGGAWDCVSRMDTSGNGAYGVHEYGGESPGLLGRNLIGGFHVGNGRLAMRAGVLVGGTGTSVEKVCSTQNQYGVHVYRTARGWSIDPASYLEGNRDGEIYIDPEAVA